MGLTKDQKKKVEACLSRHPEWADKRIASAVRPCPPIGEVRKIRQKLGIAPGSEAGTSTNKNRKRKDRGVTLDAFKKEFDVAFMIRAKVDELFSGENPGVHYTDLQFREMVQVPASNWRRFADDEEFDQWHFKQGKHDYWAHPEHIEAIKEILLA